MFDIFSQRLQQKYRTLDFPNKQPNLSARYLGRPEIQHDDCGDCHACMDACPTAAIRLLSASNPGPRQEQKGPALDMGRCLFCGACAKACEQKNGTSKIRFTQDYHIAAFAREDLIITAKAHTPAVPPRNIFGKSFKLREISAGGCNACEADTNVLGTLVYDLGKFGISFVASPRHADGIVLTGPVTRNMREAVIATWEAVPEPRLAIAVGSCAISGGLFATSDECLNGLDGLCDVQLYVPGCPPNPWSILDGLLRLKG